MAMKPPVIFLAFANDRTPEGQYLRNLVTERKKILKALEPAQKAGLCEVVYEANSNLSDIKRIFQDPVYQGRIAIFHYGVMPPVWSYNLKKIQAKYK